MLTQGMHLPEWRPVSSQSLPAAKEKPSFRPVYMHEQHHYEMPENTAGQAKVRRPRKRKVSSTISTPPTSSMGHQEPVPQSLTQEVQLQPPVQDVQRSLLPITGQLAVPQGEPMSSPAQAQMHVQQPLPLVEESVLPRLAPKPIENLATLLQQPSEMRRTFTDSQLPTQIVIDGETYDIIESQGPSIETVPKRSRTTEWRHKRKAENTGGNKRKSVFQYM